MITKNNQYSRQKVVFGCYQRLDSLYSLQERFFKYIWRGGGRFPEHGKDQLQVGHVVAQVFAFESFQFPVISRRNPKRGPGDFRGENGRILLLGNAAFPSFVVQLITDGDFPDALLNPVVRMAFGSGLVVHGLDKV